MNDISKLEQAFWEFHRLQPVEGATPHTPSAFYDVFHARFNEYVAAKTAAAVLLRKVYAEAKLGPGNDCIYQEREWLCRQTPSWEAYDGARSLAHLAENTLRRTFREEAERLVQEALAKGPEGVEGVSDVG